MTDIELPTTAGAITGPASPAWDNFWDPLLHYVEEGSVIPVVGQDLLIIEIGGRRVSLDTYLAERLAQALGQVPPVLAPDEPPMAEPLSLKRVIYRFLRQESPRSLDRIYLTLASFLDEASVDAVPVPEPLFKLAEILPFRIFVTTTFDALLERALHRIRPGEPLQVRSFSVRNWRLTNDLPDDFDPTRGTFVYHLLGRLSNKAQDFAVTEEDLLEFFHSLNRRPPVSLFDELDRGHLLIIGSSFSDWLARFFIRLPTQAERLWDVQFKRTDFLADPRLQADVTLVPFLESFCRHAASFSGGDAVAFVDELHRRWLARGRRSPCCPPTPSAEGKIFLSYVNEDASAVAKIRKALAHEELSVWIDSERLRGGASFHGEIKRAIEGCFVFIPILSQNARAWQDRYCRLEWNWAIQWKVRLPANRVLIVPVAIDDIEPDDEAIPEGLRDLTWIRLPSGEPDDAFVARIREVFRMAQKPSSAREEV